MLFKLQCISPFFATADPLLSSQTYRLRIKSTYYFYCSPVCGMRTVGLGVIAVSLWLLFDQQLYLQHVGAHQSDYYVGTYIILAVGSIMTIVGESHIA